MTETTTRDRGSGLAAQVLAGDRGALARALSAIENGDAHGDDVLRAVAGRETTATRRIGITGPPGAGKSTLVGRMVTGLLERGRRVGVLLVDPSSASTGGAVLADRIRLQRHGGDDLFVRSVASRGQAGGVTAATARFVELLEAWGADLILIETVGAGQSDIDVCKIADQTVVVCPRASATSCRR